MRALVVLLVPTLAAAEPAPDKREWAATGIAVAATAVGIGVTKLGVDHHARGVELAGYAMIAFGPSAGHVYADETVHAVAGFALRGTAILALSIGIDEMTPREEAAICAVGQPCGTGLENHQTRGKLLALAGGATLVAATLYDLYDAHRAVVRERPVQIVPVPTQGGAGVAITGQF